MGGVGGCAGGGGGGNRKTLVLSQRGYRIAEGEGLTLVISWSQVSVFKAGVLGDHGIEVASVVNEWQPSLGK